ncbi:hypothetical protein AWZ03_009654 [Drosophila navojoa]|uniref:Uncharacterized protein n=1 Tax=Drosophila navojoa TaxID=7232 RepID=A0A484B775_DRONA|nr:hypothetical protein AWZ03_009654 [Drosophila navojoa]
MTTQVVANTTPQLSQFISDRTTFVDRISHPRSIHLMDNEQFRNACATVKKTGRRLYNILEIKHNIYYSQLSSQS